MKFRLKIMLSMLGLLSVLFGAGGSLLIALSFQNALEREQAASYNAYQMVLGTLQIIGGENGPLNDGVIARTLEQLSKQNADSWKMLRLYTDERLIYDYNSAGIAYPEIQPLPGKCLISYAEAARNVHTLMLSGALEGGGETLYLDMNRDISALYEARKIQRQTYQGVFVLLFGLCAVLSYNISRILTYPLRSLSEASCAIAKGQLSSRAQIYSEDEIGLAAHDFNVMAANLEASVSELKEAMERQERFIGSFAHEVKTPMTSIIGYADLIRGQMLNAEEVLQAANYIVAEGKRLENLSQKLLEVLVLKQGEVTLVPIRLASLIQGLAAHLEPLYAKQGITLNCVCEEGLCFLEPDLTKSLLVNLLDNARKAMEGKNGCIDIEAQMLPDGCKITIRDNGRGIPNEALEHLTEAFYRVDKSRSREQGGVGLGLSLCQEIIALHKGSIRFESQVSLGTTIIVELRGGVR